MNIIKITIDGKEFKTEMGKSVLEVSLDAGIYIPHLCHHADLTPIGACRLCVVEIEGMEGLQASCTTAVCDGMAVRTKSENISEMRLLAMELMLSGHQADCGTCMKYLNCELQSLKQYLIEDELSVKKRTRVFGVTETNPLFIHNPNRCILCGRCVRACHELRGVGVLYYKKNGEESYIGVGKGRDVSLAEAGCRFCGACAEVCPTGAIMDKAEFGQGKNRKEALLPCSNTCPAGIDIPGFIRFIRLGDYTAADAVLREKVPFPKILGYVCNHPCESVCRRGEINEPMSICKLKRFAAENATDDSWRSKIHKKPETGKRVAVIGAGPAGLAAGYYLSLLGHSITVFDALPEAGGMLRYGIPEYRLPRHIVTEEIKEIEQSGVLIKTNQRIVSVDELLEQGYDAVLVAIGTHKGIKLRIPGVNGEDTLIGTEFLKSVSMGEEVRIGKRVVVLGGGNVAFDCGRVAKRLGADHVAVACLESRESMLASPEEILQGMEEGLMVYDSRTFTRILRENGTVSGVECLEVESFDFDEELGLRLETVENSKHVIDADTVIFAIGQKPDIPEGFDLDKTEKGLIEINPYTLGTSRSEIFAAGDAVTGTASVIKAIASGRTAASALDRFLGGRGKLEINLAPAADPDKYLGKIENFAELQRLEEKYEKPEELKGNFCSVIGGMDEQEAEREALRCLQCDLRMKMSREKFWASYMKV